MIYRRTIIVLIVFLLVALGCNLPARMIKFPTQTPSLPSQTADDSVLPAATNTAATDLDPTLTLEKIPGVEVDRGSLFPAGFMLLSGGSEAVTYYDLSGQPFGIIHAPGLNSVKVHLAGHIQVEPQNIPLLFHTYDNNGDIKQTLNGQVTTLVPGPGIAYLKGAPGRRSFAYVTVTWGETLSSYFYTRTTAGSEDMWVWDRVDPEGWAMVPFAVRAEDDGVQSIFYTLEPWGIGGDIVYPPRKGFFQFSLDTMENMQHITENLNPIGLSPDTTLMAYTEANNTRSPEPPINITLYDLNTTATISIPLRPESDRGGGYAVFSPDNHYVAWMEATGMLVSETSNFNTRVRVADQYGTLLAEIPVSDFGAVVADPTARWSVPVGWLDGEHLLVQIQGDNWEHPALVSMKYDGYGLTYLASGRFVDFIYP